MLHADELREHAADVRGPRVAPKVARGERLQLRHLVDAYPGRGWVEDVDGTRVLLWVGAAAPGGVWAHRCVDLELFRRGGGYPWGQLEWWPGEMPVVEMED